MADRLAWTGYAAAGCAALRVPLHVYYGLGGSAGLATADYPEAVPSLDPQRLVADPTSSYALVEALPDFLSPTAATLVWRGTHLLTALVLVGVAVLAVALVRPWGRRLPPIALIVPAFGVIVAVLGYVVSGTAGRAGRFVCDALPHWMGSLRPDGDFGESATGWTRWLNGDGLAGLTATMRPSSPERAVVRYADLLGHMPAVHPFDQVTAFGPWALALGLLLALAATRRLRGATARRIWLVAVGLAVLRLSF